MARHLVISDLHENHPALRRFIAQAEKVHGGFEDIWFLGDIFGHSDESMGQSNLTQAYIDGLDILSKYPFLTVWGNWEYWLGHPELDDSGKYQKDHDFQLKQRRLLLMQKKNRSVLERFLRQAVTCYPEGSAAEFTLFHGCSFACHGNSDYRPEPWECYLFPRDLNLVTRELFGSSRHLKTPHFLFGHTHIPGWFQHSESGCVTLWNYFIPSRAGQPVYYGNPACRFGLNPGSAGVARKNTPRTVLLLDTTEKTFTYLVDKEL